MFAEPERTAADMPDTITYAVLTVDSKLRIDSAPSNPEFDEEQEWLIQQAWLAAIGDDSSMLYTDDVDID